MKLGRGKQAGGSVRALARAVGAAIEPLEHRRYLTRYAIVGDMAETTAFNTVSAMMESWNPAHIISAGDNNNNDDADLEGTIGAKFHEWMSPYLGSMGAGSTTGNRFWPVLGNHDWDGGLTNYTNYFTLPNNERYYSVQLGEVEWFMMDSDTREPSGTSSTSTQAIWLQNALAASTATWQIVVFHHPAYSSASTPDNTYMRWPFQQWGADAIMSGHDHLYERLNVDGMPAFIVGTGGAGLHEFGAIDSHSVVRNDSIYGAMQLDASTTSLAFKYYKSDGSLYDSITLNTSPTAPSTPTNLTGTPLNSTQSRLFWTDASPGITTSFKIERSSNGGSSFSQVGTTTAGTTFFTDSSLTPGASYVYRIRASAAAGDSGYTSNVTVTLPTGTTTYLSDLTWTSATAGWGPVEKDMSIGGSLAGDGRTITLNGVTYSKGLGTHAVSDITYNLGGAYSRFLADVGVDDETGAGVVQFTVIADGQTIYDSGAVTQAGVTRSINVSVAGVQTLVLHVGNSDGTTSSDHADWAIARLQNNTPVNPPAAPSGLAATAVLPTEIDLTWGNVAGETGFRIERSTNNVTFTALNTVAADVLSYQDTTASPSTLYYYRVFAINSGGDSLPSNVADATTPASANVNYILTGNAWKYLDNGTNQGTAWRAIAFAETGWKTGNSQLGYGDGDEATVVSYGTNANQKYVTTYFRKSFTVADVSKVTALAMRLIRDDGAVVYLNGTEVYRSNLPTGTIAYNTLATDSLGGIDETNWLTSAIATNLLVNGTNVIAAEIHQADRTSSDLSFDFELTGTVVVPTPPTAPTNLAATGFSTTQINLTWTDTSSTETGFILERSPDGSTGWATVATPPAGATSASDTVVAGSQYFYRIRATNNGSDSANSAVAHSWPLAGVPSTPVPNAVVRNSTPITLDWADAPNATSYDVYTGAGNVLLGNVTVSQWTGFVPASDGAVLWKVVAKNSDNSSIGPQWSFTLDTTPPTASLGNQTPTTGSSTFDFVVTYADVTTAVDATTFDNSDITVSGPNSFSANATFVSAVGNVVTYRISAPGGTWDSADNGLYTVSQVANQLKDTAGNARPFGSIGSFTTAASFAWMTGSTLNIQFDGSATPIDLSTVSGNVIAKKGSTSLTFSGVIAVNAIGTASNDNLEIASAPPLTFSNGNGNDSIRVSSGNYAFASDLSPTLKNVAVTIDAGASATFNASQHLADLVVNGTAILAAGGSKTIVTKGLTIAGTLDLKDNTLLVDYSGASPIGAWNGSAYTGVSGLVQTGRNGGAWNGTGITTSSASGILTGLGLADASSLFGNQTTNFQGETIDATTLVIKFTYVGDADLSGTITGDDYFRIDSAYPAGTGYANGDFDFSGKINADDYFFIDYNYNKAQSPPAPQMAPAIAFLTTDNELLEELV